MEEPSATGAGMDIADIDYALWPEVLTEVHEHLPALERDLHRLVHEPDSAELLSSAFRHLHTIKGDLGYCRATPIMEFVHHLENVMQSLRSGVFQCSALIAEAMLQSLDQVTDMMDTLTRTHRFDQQSRDGLLRLIEQLAAAREQVAADEIARHILLSAHGEWLEALPETGVPLPQPSPESAARALAVGKQLAAALAARHGSWPDRAELQWALVEQLNRQYRRPSDSQSLAIAVYWHDVGLLALPDRMLHTVPKRKTPDWLEYAKHPQWAADWLLAVAPDCVESAQMICQHHQWVNGFGIPAPAYSGSPHQGAMMLACADLYYDRVAGLQGEEFRRGVLRALFDVNGGLDSTFDAQVINAFQAVARDMQPLAGGVSG